MKTILVPLSETDIAALQKIMKGIEGSYIPEIYDTTIIPRIIARYLAISESESQQIQVTEPYLKIAAEILDSSPKSLPSALKLKLFRLNRLVERCGGTLSSQETISLAILDFLDRKTE